MSEEQEGELEVRTYTISSPDMLEVMLEYTEILEKVARGEISQDEAKILYVEKILPAIKELQEKYAPREVKKKPKKDKKTPASKTSKKRRKAKSSKG